jgi:hypothetical protein
LQLFCKHKFVWFEVNTYLGHLYSCRCYWSRVKWLFSVKRFCFFSFSVLSRGCFKNLVYEIKKWSKMCIEDKCGSGGVATHFVVLYNGLTWLVCFTLWEEPCYPRDSGLGETQSHSRQMGEEKSLHLCRQLNTYLSIIQRTGWPLFWLTIRAVVRSYETNCRTKTGRRNVYCKCNCVLCVLGDNFYRTHQYNLHMYTCSYKSYVSLNYIKRI